MSDDLRKRVEDRHGPLHEQDVPTDAEAARQLATDDPDRFNALMDAGLIPRKALAPEREEDQ